ncbi:MAG: hypothetical protein ABSF66_11230 [Terriglobales bacterium]
MHSIPQIRTNPAALFRSGVCFPVRLLTEGAAQEPAAENSAEKKNESREEDTEENKARRTQTTAGHKLKHHSALARRSAQVESQRLKEDFHVLESPPIVGSQSFEKPRAEN